VIAGREGRLIVIMIAVMTNSMDGGRESVCTIEAAEALLLDAKTVFCKK